MISDAEARSIQDAYDRNEGAREAFDPKRFKRGGGYTPEDIKAIDKLAGIAKPSNDQLGKLEVYKFMKNPPEKFSAYYSEDMRHVKTWMGDVLGTIVSKGKGRRPFGGRVVSIRVQAINGLSYVGNCNMSSGTYCTLRRAKS